MSIPLLVPRIPTVDRILGYLRMIDEAAWYTNFGPLVRRLEERLADTLDLEAAQLVSVSNATLGLEVALMALRLPRGARVMVPSFTFVATACAIERAGYVPVMADVDPGTWTLTPEIALRAMAETPVDAVMPVSTFGNALDPHAWSAFATQTGLPVVIDAAGAFGNQKLAPGIAAVFSMHATKALGIGEGGFVACHDAAYIHRVRQLTNFGIDVSTGIVEQSGTNAKLSEYHAAVGLVALDDWPENSLLRRGVDALYRATLARLCPGVTLQVRPSEGTYTIQCVRLPDGVRPAEVAGILREAGIGTRSWYTPLLHQHPAFSAYPRAAVLADAEDLARTTIGLPFYAELDAAHIEKVAGMLAAAIGRRGGAV